MAPTERVENNAPQPGKPLNALKLHKWKKRSCLFSRDFFCGCYVALEVQSITPTKKKYKGIVKKIEREF